MFAIFGSFSHIFIEKVIKLKNDPFKVPYWSNFQLKNENTRNGYTLDQDFWSKHCSSKKNIIISNKHHCKIDKNLKFVSNTLKRS